MFTWGRVQYEKGFQVLARAMSLLRARVPGVRCVIGGRGSYLPELQSQIDQAATFNGTYYLVAATLFVAITIPLARFTDWLVARDRRRQQAGRLA